MSHFYNSFPPSHIHSSKGISAEEALEHVTSYIEAGQSNPSLRPDATLTESGARGVSAAGISSSGGSLAMHNLTRVQAALQGEHLTPLLKPGRDKTPDEAEAVVPETPTIGHATARKRKAQSRDGNAAGWQDPEIYQRQQQVIHGDTGDRTTEIAEGEEAMKNLEEAQKNTDKAARKKAKKERSKNEKRERERARQEANS